MVDIIGANLVSYRTYLDSLAASATGVSKVAALNTAEDAVNSATPAELLHSAGTESTDPGYTGRWSDVDTDPPKSLRIRDRVFVGSACETDDTRHSGASHQTDWYPYANWAPRDSDFVVMSSFGGLAITGMTRTSDKYTLLPETVTPSSGVSAFVINDYAAAFGRALYVDVQRESGAGGSVGIEAACKNLGTDVNTTAYSASGDGVIGAWFAAGGDPVYGGTAANPCNVALHIKNGTATTVNYRWNRGLVFSATAITGTDGTGGDTGTGVAIEMAKQHQIQWKRPNDVVGAFIKSVVGNSGLGGGIRFDPDYTYITDGSGTIAARVEPVASGVNYVSLLASATGGAVQVQAIGTDSDIPITLLPKGASGVRYKQDVSVSPSGSSPSSASSGRIFTNEGATGLATFNLPSAAVGLCFEFAVMDTDGIRVVAAAGDDIRIAASVSATAGRIDNSTIGGTVKLVAVNATNWVATAVNGTWTVT